MNNKCLLEYYQLMRGGCQIEESFTEEKEIFVIEYLGEKIVGFRSEVFAAGCNITIIAQQEQVQKGEQASVACL